MRDLVCAWVRIKRLYQRSHTIAGHTTVPWHSWPASTWSSSGTYVPLYLQIPGVPGSMYYLIRVVPYIRYLCTSVPPNTWCPCPSPAMVLSWTWNTLEVDCNYRNGFRCLYWCLYGEREMGCSTK